MKSGGQKQLKVEKNVVLHMKRQLENLPVAVPLTDFVSFLFLVYS